MDACGFLGPRHLDGRKLTRSIPPARSPTFPSVPFSGCSTTALYSRSSAAFASARRRVHSFHSSHGTSDHRMPSPVCLVLSSCIASTQ
jgi:hypothetical protein